MTLTIELRFHTSFGQRLYISGDHPLFGGGDIARAIPLRYKNASSWEITLWVPDGFLEGQELRYDYVLREPDGTLIRDWGVKRTLPLERSGDRQIVVIDSWNYAGFYENSFYTEPFQRVLLKSKEAAFEVSYEGQPTHRFSIGAPLLEANETLCILGNSPALGSWNTDSPVLMNREPGSPELWANVRLGPRDFPLEYKYGVFDISARKFVRFESGANRVIDEAPGPETLVLVRDLFAKLPSSTWKGAGVAIPVFSLRSERSFGIGEFPDLQSLTDWCVETGLKLIQVLPINDTIATKTWKDSYPYSAISAFALHPVYLCLDEVATTPESKRLLEELADERSRLNRLPSVDFEKVLSTKLRFLRAVFEFEKARTLSSREYHEFWAHSANWLLPYAVFSALRDRYNTIDFTSWPEHREITQETLRALAAGELRNEVEFASFVQFHLHLQLQAAAEYAHMRGVVLKGDIPIGVFRWGADAWQAPAQFDMRMQSGAPPDAFAEKGQNWEFPTYNWEHMEQDNFSWWRARFTQMSRYFDAFRIDHILGFFRIWSIPRHAVQGILGYFVPALPVREEEFRALGIPFNYKLFVRPRITDRSLNALFGPESDKVIQTFLEPIGPGVYQMKEPYSTQRKVEGYFQGNKDEKTVVLKKKLFELIADVLLIEDLDHPGAFHFRFSCEQTTAFQELEPEIQRRVRDLYVDYFYRRQDRFWMAEAWKKLPGLKRATHMLICGEDLGMVPTCLPQVMRDVGLLSLEIQRMPKDRTIAFGKLEKAPYLSVVSPSTHDMSTIRGWWEEDPGITQRFYREELHFPGFAPATCTAEINGLIVYQHLRSSAMWSIFQMQDLLGSDEALRRENPHEERINIPADPDHRWCYRMHLTLEQLLHSHEFNKRLRRWMIECGRA